MEEIKIFSGTEIEAMAFEQKLSDLGVEPIKKNGFESARLAGFGNLDATVELFVNEEDYEKVKDLVE